MATIDFTERERTIMAYAWQCFEEQPKVDYVKLASLVGMSNPRSATNAWLNIKKKLVAQATTAAEDEGSEVTTPTTATKKRKIGSDDSAKSTPTPAKRSRKSKKTVQADEGKESEEHQDSMVKSEPDLDETCDDEIFT